MYSRKLEELTKRGRKAQTYGELLQVQVEIAGVIALALEKNVGPVSEITMVPLVATLEDFVRGMREQIDDPDFEDELAQYREHVSSRMIAIQLPEPPEEE